MARPVRNRRDLDPDLLCTHRGAPMTAIHQTERRRLVKDRPPPTLLENGDMIVPVHRGDGWDVIRIDCDSPHYVEWLTAWQRSNRTRGVNLEAFVSFLLPPVSVLFALARLLRDEVGPGLGMLLAGWLGTGAWLWVLVTYAGLRFYGS